MFFVDLKAINRGKDDKRGYLKFYFGIASLVRPAWVYSNGCKSLTRPDSGKCLANAKGVHRELESEGR